MSDVTSRETQRWTLHCHTATDVQVIRTRGAALVPGDAIEVMPVAEHEALVRRLLSAGLKLSNAAEANVDVPVPAYEAASDEWHALADELEARDA